MEIKFLNDTPVYGNNAVLWCAPPLALLVSKNKNSYKIIFFIKTSQSPFRNWGPGARPWSRCAAIRARGHAVP